MKNGLSYFEDGGLAREPEEAPAEFTLAPPKGAAAKKTPLGPTQTADLLSNMQAMIERRESPMAIFSRGMERAAAWGSGGLGGPSAALNQLNQREQLEDKSTFDMRQQMAAYRAAQERQRRGAETLGFGVQPTAQAGAQPGMQPAAQPGMQPAAQLNGQAGYLTMLNSLPPSVRPGAMVLLQNGDFEKFAELVSAHELKRPDIQKNLQFAETLPAGQGDVFKRQVFEKAYGPQTYVDAEGRSFQYSLPDAMPPEMRNQPRPAAPATTGVTIPTSAIRQVESGGNAAAVSPKGAEGTMQVMPATQVAPGFGVTPAANKTPQELERVGGDYFAAMKNKYKDDVTAAIAYNMGPGATDKWIAAGKKFDQLPAETQDYVKKLTTQPQAPAAQPVQRKSVGELETEKTYRTELAQGAAKNAIEAEKEFRKTTEAKSVIERKTSAQRVIELVQQYPQSTGVLAKPGIANALLTIARDGINTPSGAIGVRAIEDALVLTMPGTSKEIVGARKEIAQNMARAALETSKLSQGQGAVSDYERSLFERVSGSLADTPELLIKRQQMLVARADLDQKLGNMYRLSKSPGKPTDYEAFTTRPDVVKLIDQYENQLNSILGSEASVGKQGAPAIPKYDAQKEARYQQWKNSQGNKQ
jgi:hypothetical protein